MCLIPNTEEKGSTAATPASGPALPQFRKHSWWENMPTELPSSGKRPAEISGHGLCSYGMRGAGAVGVGGWMVDGILWPGNRQRKWAKSPHTLASSSTCLVLEGCLRNSLPWRLNYSFLQTLLNQWGAFLWTLWTVEICRGGNINSY